jgi:hypothetical protein
MEQILMHFPQGLDLELSDAARLLEPGCCGQPAGPPWIDTRTYTERSLDSDSPSVLMKADTGERILHFLEIDARAEGLEIPGRQVVFLRPGLSLEPGERYIVAMRDLKTAANTDVVAEAAFASGCQRNHSLRARPRLRFHRTERGSADPATVVDARRSVRLVVDRREHARFGYLHGAGHHTGQQLRSG